MSCWILWFCDVDVLVVLTNSVALASLRGISDCHGKWFRILLLLILFHSPCVVSSSFACHSVHHPSTLVCLSISSRFSFWYSSSLAASGFIFVRPWSPISFLPTSSSINYTGFGLVTNATINFNWSILISLSLIMCLSVCLSPWICMCASPYLFVLTNQNQIIFSHFYFCCTIIIIVWFSSGLSNSRPICHWKCAETSCTVRAIVTAERISVNNFLNHGQCWAPTIIIKTRRLWW